MQRRDDIRNVAIIAHVDHGKTTLIDVILQQTGIFRDNQQVERRVMDSNDLEKERGITIFAKNASFRYGGKKINIVDTPGHADFGGEVERILNMVDGVLLLVDAFEGPMPQTKFVLRKALELGLKPLVVINKVDRPRSRPIEVHDLVLDLFIELGAHEDQLEFAYVFASAKNGYAMREFDPTIPEDVPQGTDLTPLLDMIVSEIPGPEVELDGPLQMVVTTLDYNDYLGRIAIGRIRRGEIRANQNVAVLTPDTAPKRQKLQKLFGFEALKRVEIESAQAGDIVAIAGLENVTIGETIADADQPEALPTITVDEPTISMNFQVNTSPFAGLEGKYVTSRHLRDRLHRELLSNVALRVEDTDSADAYKVSGRGELHLSVLIETMRREGYELAVGPPQVIFREIDGVVQEPVEQLVIDVPEEHMGVVMEKLGQRKAEMQNMAALSTGVMRLEFSIPTRGLLGYRTEFMTDTKGEGILTHSVAGYQPMKGDVGGRRRGVLVALERGDTSAYAIYNLEDRGTFFLSAGVSVYEGMIVGENAREDDIVINVTKKKQMSNMRSSGADEALRLTPYRVMSLEQAMEFIADDELVEVTPKSIRMRKRVLNKGEREISEKRRKSQMVSAAATA